MTRHSPRPIAATSLAFLASIITPLTYAQTGDTGEKLYATYCSACHATDGKGATGGAFPPLADSSWLKGDPDRAIQVVLHGLTGELTINDKDYNLAMPPQGATLSDQQIAKVLTFVRSNFGNKQAAVTEAQVKKIRDATTKRSAPWVTDHLLKFYPLAQEEGPIGHLIRNTYAGDWNTLPDFSKLKSTSVEEEFTGYLNLKNIKTGDKFGVVWEGTLKVPATGEFTFTLNSDDGSAVYLSGKKVIAVEGLGPIVRQTKQKIKLSQGTVPIRVEYFDKTGPHGIQLLWQGPGLNGVNWLSEKPVTQKVVPRIDLSPQGNEAVMYNNFLKGTTPRSLAVGLPGGMNYAFSKTRCAIDLVWTGAFIDGYHHWTGRGVGAIDPSGGKIAVINSDVAFAVLEKPDSPWPKDLAANFKGYKLDKLRQPTFTYETAGMQITDAPLKSEIAGTLKRTITVAAASDTTQTVYFRVANNLPVKAMKDGQFSLGTLWKVSSSGKAASTPVILGNELRIPLQLKKGNNTFTLIYSAL